MLCDPRVGLWRPGGSYSARRLVPGTNERTGARESPWGPGWTRGLGSTHGALLPDPPGFSHGWPWALPAACQPSLQRGVRGVSPRLKKRVPPPSSRTPRPLSLALSFSLSHSLLLLPFPWLLFSRTPLSRQADPPYPAGGPSLPGRRARPPAASPPYPAGGPSLAGRRPRPSLPGRQAALDAGALRPPWPRFAPAERPSLRPSEPRTQPNRWLAATSWGPALAAAAAAATAAVFAASAGGLCALLSAA